MVALKQEIDRLAQPPSGYGVFLELFDDGTVDVFTAGRKLRVAVSPDVASADLRRGRYVMLDASAERRFGPFAVGDYREFQGRRLKSGLRQ